MNEIPELDLPTGLSWTQPDRKNILVSEDGAIMSQADYDLLYDYSASMPSGVCPGKMWKAIYADGPYLRWFGVVPHNPKVCSIHSRPITIGDWKEMFAVDQKPTKISPIKKPKYIVKLNTP